MTTIKVALYGECPGCLFNNQTIAAEITEEKDMYVAHFGASDNGRSSLASDPNICTDSIVILYSNKSLADFKIAYEEQFGPLKERTWSCLTKNCADSVNFTLNFFFPDNKSACLDKSKIDTYCGCGKVVCACGIPSAVIGCLPPPPGVNTPQLVFNKARLLKYSYGKPVKNEATALLSSGPDSQSMEEQKPLPTSVPGTSSSSTRLSTR